MNDAMPNPWLFHITHISNLLGIIKQGGLLANNTLNSHYTNIAHQSIQTRRHSSPVPCGAGGMLHDYVPFYFCRRSPMLYAIYKNKIDGYEGGQTEVIYLVTRFSTIQKSGLSWVFTDGHAAMAFSDFYDNPIHFNQVDWELMTAKYWHDTDDEPDRKRRRQAEFLVHQHLPWSCLRGIAVYDGIHKRQVESILNTAPLINKPSVEVLPNWYY